MEARLRYVARFKTAQIHLPLAELVRPQIALEAVATHLHAAHDRLTTLQVPHYVTRTLTLVANGMT